MRHLPRAPWLWTVSSMLALGTACAGGGSGGDASAHDGASASPSPERDGAVRDAAVEQPPLDAGTSPGPDADVVPRLDSSVDAQRDSGAAADASGANDAATPSYACPVPAPAACPTPAPRYPEIAAIIKQRCASCHSPLWTGPWPLDTFGHVADWQDTIQENLLACTMPPADAGVPITADERVRILTWIKCGLPQ